jgi:hypothetical protein
VKKKNIELVTEADVYVAFMAGKKKLMMRKEYT